MPQRAESTVGGNTVAPAFAHSPWSLVGHIATRRGVESTGVGRKGDEPISESLGEVVKGLAFSAGMAADLALVEDQ